MLVSTGDLVDSYMDSPESLATMFKNIPTQYGKFAITGNHELYADLDYALGITDKADFTILRGSGKTPKAGINIVGVDDPARGPYRSEHMVLEKDLLQNLPREKFTLFLKHQPITSKASLGLHDLQLSGRTHQGQIIPSIL